MADNIKSTDVKEYEFTDKLSNTLNLEHKGVVSKVIASPWVYIPAIYVVAGAVEGGVLLSVTGIMYKDMGYSNAFIGFLTLLHLPLIFSFLWAPYVDGLGSKRNLTILFLFGMAVITGLFPAIFFFNYAFMITSLGAFACLSIMSTFFKISSEGYYIRILEPKQQAAFIGIKTAAIRLGIIGTIAILVRMAGEINIAKDSKTLGWFWMYIILTVIIMLTGLYNLFYLPKAKDDSAVRHSGNFVLFQVIMEYLKQKKAIYFIIFIFIYRFGEGLLARMIDPFLMDPRDKGGFGLDVSTLAMVKSFAYMPCVIVGGILGGWLIKKFTLKKSFIPLAWCMAIPHIGYWYIARTMPSETVEIFGSMLNTGMLTAVCIEAFGYGIGFSAFFYYLHAMALGPNKTSIFAISTALMGLGFYLPCAISGVVQEAFGYEVLFFLSIIFALPGIVMIKFLPKAPS